MSFRIPIVIADNHEIFRKALISHFKDIDNRIQIVGEAENGAALIELLKIKQPEVLLLDLEMPVMNGSEALNVIAKKYPQISVVVFSGFLDERLIAHYMSKGALACLSKDCDSDTLLDAIYAVKDKKPYCLPTTSGTLLKALIAEKNNTAMYSKLRLSSREVEVLKEICKGSTSKEISKALNIAPVTVDFHKSRLFKKTGTDNLVKLAMYAVKAGIAEA